MLGQLMATPTPVRVVSPDQIFATPAADFQCSYFDGTEVYDESLCSHFSISRLYRANHEEAVRRAGVCAAEAELECILSIEIGLGFPVAFVFEDGQMRAIVAPQLLPHESENATFQVFDPYTQRYTGAYVFDREIKAEFLDGQDRHPTTEVLNGTVAYCVSLLRQAFTPECWAALE